MLEVFGNIINCLITTVLGFYIIKIITKSKIEIKQLKTIILLIVSSLITAFFQQSHYAGFHTLIIFAINIIIYKLVFNINITDSIIATGLAMIFTFIGEFIVSLILIPIFTLEQIEANWIIKIIVNLMIVTATILFLRIKIICEKTQIFYKNIHKNKTISNIIFLILIVVITTLFAFDMYLNFNFSYKYISNITITIIIGILMSLYMNNKNELVQLNDKYDNLFSYMQNFEEWIEREQLNRHEYKNQLAVLRCLTKEKRVKNKIDEILENNIKLEGEVVNQLKCLPKGGLKGLMYYKSAIAQKNKINLTVNVSIARKTYLSNLKEKEINILSKLIGIYFDNAIEAAKTTKKKIILLEIYELNETINIVISNTFYKHKNFENRNNKGVTTKGDGHGYGLYFAKKLLSENKWIEQKQEIIDKYYIQTIKIKKS